MTFEELHPLLQAYYTELNPEIRKEHLDAYTAAAASAGAVPGPADAYRKLLFQTRHVNQKRPDQPVDRFLWHLLNLTSICKSPGFFPKSHKRQVLSIMKKLETDDRPRTDEDCREVLYHELRNAVHRYFVTCQDSSYGRNLFGMMPANNEKRAAMCCIDIWSFSFGIARMVGLEEELSVLCRAANDEYCALVPGTASLEDAYRIISK